MPVPWTHIEAETLHRINNLKSDSPADIVTSYETVPKNTTIADDAGFALTSIRQAIVDTTMEVISYICKADGDPRRQQYKHIAGIAHGGDLPSSIGPYGAISDDSTKRSLEPRPATEISEIRANPNNVYGNPPPTFFYYALDGQKIYHTLTGNASIEYFYYTRPANSFASLNQLFSSENEIALIPDEFVVVIADGAAGRIAGKAGSLIAEAANFMQLYYQGLKDRGLNVRAQIDYSPQPN